MQRTEFQSQELRVLNRKKTSASVTYAIGSLWVILVCLYLQRPILMIYTLMFATCAFAYRLRQLRIQRDKLLTIRFNREVYGSRDDTTFDLERYIEESERELEDRIGRETSDNIRFMMGGNLPVLPTEEGSDFEMDDQTPPRIIARPRGPHPDHPVRPTPHAGQAWEEPEFFEPDLPAEWSSDPEDSRDDLDVLRRNIREINVAYFNRVSQPVPFCPSV